MAKRKPISSPTAQIEREPEPKPLPPTPMAIGTPATLPPEQRAEYNRQKEAVMRRFFAALKAPPTPVVSKDELKTLITTARHTLTEFIEASKRRDTWFALRMANEANPNWEKREESNAAWCWLSLAKWKCNAALVESIRQLAPTFRQMRAGEHSLITAPGECLLSTIKAVVAVEGCVSTGNVIGLPGISALESLRTELDNLAPEITERDAGEVAGIETGAALGLSEAERVRKSAILSGVARNIYDCLVARKVAGARAASYKQITDDVYGKYNVSISRDSISKSLKELRAMGLVGRNGRGQAYAT